jgi:hypothetical protein
MSIRYKEEEAMGLIFEQQKIAIEVITITILYSN